MVELDLANLDDVDALAQMLKLTFSNDDWQPMIRIADRLYEIALNKYLLFEKEEYTFLSSRPLIYYLGYSQLCKGIALQKLRRYEEARMCISKYEDLSCFKGQAEKDKYIIEDFQKYAVGNSFTLDLLEGKESQLPGYITYLKHNNNEIFAGMITVFEAALKNNFNIDWVLNELQDDLIVLQESSNIARVRYYTEYLYLYSLYEYKRENYYFAVQKNLEALAVCSTLGDNRAFKKMVALFECFRHYASEEQEQSFKMQLKTILEAMLEDEKDISLRLIYSGNYQ
ncbi:MULTISPECIES: hypothetical protein [unclassified Paenibacillus]|uniref:hypothetical protein n=1 Tax=unclassified Paenibacillus TaxID=185978 RepID=UPI00240736B0|nr:MULTISPECIES: hypothetical protein [unclassified Paenibacillus]MDF9839435.1 hypothetical protein [Paenibacillus sp. PastF-2]MDF9846015.1 hypothetical protein [Paenibacillus sp. PastM-2]MDF9852588.1 hypothetical protein [Paenibacillus sp. PastF-1]MDH6477682.1 hypothetical protein [Paenibacillus sp. PastH-2]MDH6505421.1 hypothetical protein [Paenibacillus sp. PastM-3]